MRGGDKMKIINLDKEIEIREKAIAFQIKKSGLTEEQLIYGSRLKFLYDKHFNFNETDEDDHKAIAMFWEMASTLMVTFFDFRPAIEIANQEEVLKNLKEIQKDNGFLILESERYYAFTSERRKTYVSAWDACADFIEYGGLEIVPDELQDNEEVQKMLASLK